MSKKYADEMLEQAYNLYAGQLERFCLSRLGEAYESTGDCVQEAFYIYYKRLLSNEHFENPRAFLYRTVSNMALRAKDDYYKNASRTKSIDDADEVNEITVYMNDAVTDYNDYDKLKNLLIAKLSDEEQRLYQMKYADKMSLAEIALVLEINDKAVANRTHRLRQKIKRLIEPILTEYGKGGS